MDRLPRLRRQYAGVHSPGEGSRDDFLVVACNFTPVVRGTTTGVGVPECGWYEEIFNSDSDYYGGSNVGNGPGVDGRRDRKPRPAARSRSPFRRYRPSSSSRSGNANRSRLAEPDLDWVVGAGVLSCLLVG